MKRTHHRRSRTAVCDANAARRTFISRRMRLVFLLAAALVVMLSTSIAVSASDTRSLNTERVRGGQQVRGKKPSLVWIDGVLARDRVGAWMLSSGTRLQTGSNVRWKDSETGREVSPASGRQVRLMGQWHGGVFRVRQATVISTQEVFERQQNPASSGAQPQAVNEPS
jgi:hypothetical protein